ncbi:hypothetical protein Dsin_024211 [Dipteronia sinensis]|uniref:Reverse transcriptase domain-containing protein n=1 Tax=Dipteronia sinensis TaxID=43782 RepID=A0AAE0A6D9_9ROSI|nr:hypothetical protein Dsin_024211 [Dipteronia sinensis]
MRRIRDMVNGLFDEEGFWRVGQQDSERVVTVYFDKLFRSGGSDCVATTHAGGSVTEACLWYLNEGESLAVINITLKFLIPKVKLLERMTKFRSISLCNAINKIISKALASRLRNVIGEVVSEEVTKAYDRVEWDFLAKAMGRLDFSPAWIGRIMGYVTLVSFFFLVNGVVCGLVFPSKGLRQGDTLSLYLYLLVTEGFSSLIRKAVLKRDYKSFQASILDPLISLFFLQTIVCSFLRPLSRTAITSVIS